MAKKILWFSCGVTSAVACKIALEKYGKKNCLLAYIKIDSAHPDNKRFINDCEKWYGAPIEIFRSGKYKDQYDVIEKTKYVNGVGGARCTLELKKKVRYAIEEKYEFEKQNKKQGIHINRAHGWHSGNSHSDARHVNSPG